MPPNYGILIVRKIFYKLKIFRECSLGILKMLPIFIIGMFFCVKALLFTTQTQEVPCYPCVENIIGSSSDHVINLSNPIVACLLEGVIVKHPMLIMVA